MSISTDITGKIHTMPGNDVFRERFDAIDWGDVCINDDESDSDKEKDNGNR